MTIAGRVEVLSTVCAIGWIEVEDGRPRYVYATLGDKVIGDARADFTRPDLTKLAAEGTLNARAFAVVFDREVPPEQVPDIELHGFGVAAPMFRSPKLAMDRYPRLRIFVMGSPRSGTSELGDTLANQLRLPWLGEGHAAPHFAAAADALSGNPDSPNGLVRFMAKQDFRSIPIHYLRATYYFMHASASFLDKTPGLPMIRCAPFLASCFPDGKFIYLRRNGVSNVLSRLSKFGGEFASHCRDWAAALNEWATIRERLPHFLELEQEEMLKNPEAVAEQIAHYLDIPEISGAIGTSLRSGTRERTGAGIGRTRLAETGWTPAQCAIFERICGPTMTAFGYNGGE